MRPRGHGTETGFVRAAGAGTRRSAEKVLRRAQGQAASVTASDQSSRAYAPHSLYSPGRGLSLGVSQSATEPTAHETGRGLHEHARVGSNYASCHENCPSSLLRTHATLMQTRTLTHTTTESTQRCGYRSSTEASAPISISVCIQTRTLTQQLEAHNDARWLYTQLSRGF